MFKLIDDDGDDYYYKVEYNSATMDPSQPASIYDDVMTAQDEWSDANNLTVDGYDKKPAMQFLTKMEIKSKPR